MIYLIITIGVLSCILFIVVALLFPEWVGIHGKKSREIESHHRPEDPSESP